MSAQSLINEHGVSCTIQRATESLDSGRAPKETFATVATETLFIQDYSGSEGMRYMAEHNRRGGKAFGSVDSVVVEQDRIVTPDSRTLDVQAVRSRGTGRIGHTIIEWQENL